MKKALFLLIAVLLLAKFNCDEEEEYCGDEEYEPKNVDDCQKLKLPNDEEGENYKHCCFLEAKFKGVKGKSCIPLTQKQYDDIDDFIDKGEDAGYSDVSLDCGSNYIMVSLLSLILLFL